MKVGVRLLSALHWSSKFDSVCCGLAVGNAMDVFAGGTVLCVHVIVIIKVLITVWLV